MNATADTPIFPAAENAARHKPQARHRRQAPKAQAGRKRPTAPTKGEASTKTKRDKRRSTGQRVAGVIERCEASVHLSVACTLIVIAFALLGETLWTLATTGPFVSAACTAVGEVLLVLILVEIARTVRMIPDDNGSVIRKLIVIAIMSALREVLWIGVSPAFAGSNASGGVVDKPLDLAVSTAAVLGLVFAFGLMRRTGKS
jgi:uncharacterized membrane protein (DUF373 family)